MSKQSHRVAWFEIAVTDLDRGPAHAKR